MDFNELDTSAISILLEGAESYVEDYIDEDGDFTEEEFEYAYSTAMQLLSGLRNRRYILVDLLETLRAES